MKNLLLLFLLSTSILSCTTLFGLPVKEGMQTWMGASKHQLLTIWGPPAKNASDGNGGEILTFYWIFQNNTGTATAITNGQYTNIKYTTPSTRVSEANVYVDSSGKIYHWRTNFNRLWQSNVNPYR